MVDLQHCVDFCCTAKWFSYIHYIHNQDIHIQYIHRLIFHILFYYGLSLGIEYSSLCYTVGSCCLSMCSVTQSNPTLCDPMACSPPGSSVHGILQARILEWVAISFYMGSSWPRNWTGVSCIAGRFSTSCLFNNKAAEKAVHCYYPLTLRIVNFKSEKIVFQTENFLVSIPV